jgi:type I restriction enzyme S subunit
VTIAECAADEPYATQIGPFGEKIRAEMYTSVGAPVLRGTNVNTDERFHDSDFVFIDPEVAEREFGKFVCEADDVILCHKGTLGKIGIIPKRTRFKKYIMGNSMMKVRCDKKKLEPLYLYYWLTSRDGQDYLFSRVSQVGVPQIQRPLTTLREATLPLPPLSEQRAIAHILGTLDDKIELNRRMNETLEAMARALFKSWFVDFDPVRAKAERRAGQDVPMSDGRHGGRDSRPTDPGLPKPVADLFPDSFEDSEQGEIPKEWNVGTVDEEFNLTMGQSPPGETYNETGEGLPFFQGRADFGFRFPSQRVFCTAPTRFAEAGDTLISVRAPVGAINMASARCCIGRGVAAARHKTGSRSYTYYFMHSIEEVFDRFEAEGTVFGSISKKDFHNIQRIMPPAQVVNAFERLAASIDDKIAMNDRESHSLATLRDALLPKLISGEVRVNEMIKRYSHG